MSLTTFVGRRMKFKRDSRHTSPGVVIAVTGIAVAYIIMLLALSIVSGFKAQIIQKLAGFNSQISILPPIPTDENMPMIPLRLNDTIENIVHEVIPHAQLSMTVHQPAVFKTDSAFQGIVLRGLDNNGNWDFIRENIIQGSAPSLSADSVESVVISSVTASALGVQSGQKLLTHFFDGNSLRSRSLTITGIYDSHFNDFDRSIAFAPIKMLQQLHQLDSLSGTSIEITGAEMGDIAEASAAIYELLLRQSLSDAQTQERQPMIYRVESMLQQCAMYINWLNLLDTNVVVIIILMAAVAGFTLVSSLFIIILERVNMIGLFKALGATNSQIRKLFIFMAQRLVVRGLIVGNIIGLGIVFAQSAYHILPLDPDAYYLNYVPMQFSLPAVILLNCGVIIISAAILIIPSCLISSLSPVKSLKYE